MKFLVSEMSRSMSREREMTCLRSPVKVTEGELTETDSVDGRTL